MNKFLKVFVAVLGGINVVFSIFIPISVAVLLINVAGFKEIWSPVLLIAGTIASLYRAIDVGFLRK